MTLRSPTFERLVSAGADRLSRALSVEAKERVAVFIIVVGEKEYHVAGTAPLGALHGLIPDIAATCAEVA